MGFTTLAGWEGFIMTDLKLVSISSFQWASVAQYMVYISGAAGLHEINTDHVYSFPLARMGGERLVNQKRKVSGLLSENLQSLERFAGCHKDDLEESEMSVIRGLYRQTKMWIELIEGHINTAEMYRVTERVNSLFDGGGAEDEFPF